MNFKDNNDNLQDVISKLKLSAQDKMDSVRGFIRRSKSTGSSIQK